MTTSPVQAVSRDAIRDPRSAILVRYLGRAEYVPTWEAMRNFTASRDAATADELWLLEHPPVFTQGQGGRPEHLLDPGQVPVVRIDRGGQVTYHGPGQAVIYLLLDLRRKGYGVKELVRRMEQAVIDLLAEYGVAAARRAGAPGVYVGGAKVAALGLRVRAGCCYHGLAFNVDMDLEPFRRINPCGYPGLAVTQCRDLGIPGSAETLGEMLAHKLMANL
ncbi:MAG TPA: lipoyl(octanoyl) transferase LipB [Burkholderiales bacterium]|nr:lipoyl(octanoyl) transferase LipB [Burkholderiales bacterium]